MKSTKMEKFQEKGLKDLSALTLSESEMTGLIGGSNNPPIEPLVELTLRFSVRWENFFNGSLFTGGGIDEFD
ncbi:MAG: hypothetical protein RBR35_13240 [Salinivirgaceae bacterium]|nr:hypothetical protein [Salinivirgaceae bacterium]